jgi:small GTP-binding protein
MDEEDGPCLKVILVAATGVGKTSLINCYFAFDNATDTNPTVAPAFCAVKMSLGSGGEVELHVWDTAGQEKYQATNRSFYRDSNIAFVCYDKLAMGTIADWITKVHEEAPTCSIFLVATKWDLLSPEERTDLTEYTETARGDVGAVGCWFTSARTGYGVKELFMAAAQRIGQEKAPVLPVTVISQGGRRTISSAEGCSC